MKLASKDLLRHVLRQKKIKGVARVWVQGMEIGRDKERGPIVILHAVNFHTKADQVVRNTDGVKFLTRGELTE